MKGDIKYLLMNKKSYNEIIEIIRKGSNLFIPMIYLPKKQAQYLINY